MQSIAYTDYYLTIPINAEQVLFCTGNYLRCLYSDQADFKIGFEEGAEGFFAQGMQVKVAAGDEPFKKVRIRNTSGAVALNVRIGVGYGDLSDDRFLFSGSILSNAIVATGLTESTDLTATTGVATTLFNTNANRVKAIVQNLEPIGGTSIRVGNAPTASKGILLAPQQAIELETTALIKVFHSKGSNLDVARSEITK